MLALAGSMELASFSWSARVRPEISTAENNSEVIEIICKTALSYVAKGEPIP